MDHVAGVDRALAARHGRVGHDEGTGRRVEAERAHVLGLGAVALEPDDPAGRDLACRPVVHREAPGAQRLHARLQAREEAVEQQGPLDRPATARLREARHCRRDVGREVRARPAGVDPDPDHDARVVGPEAVGLAQDAAELAERATAQPGHGFGRDAKGPVRLVGLGRVRLDHEVVRPLQADGADPEARDLLGRVGHRQAGHGGQAPGVAGREPGGPEADGEEQGRARRGRPGAPGPAAAGSLLVGNGKADLGRAGVEPRADRVVRRPDPLEPFLPREERRHRLAAAPGSVSTGSAVASSKAAWSARTAASRSCSAIVQVIRTSDVEIISMLTPASDRVPNIRAA